MSEKSKETPTQDKDQKSLLMMLQEAQRKSDYLSQEVMEEPSKSLGIPKSEVYGVATFYTFLSTKPQGRNVIRVCRSLPCFLKNSQLIIKSIEQEIGIKPGETTPDGKFSFQLTNCIGACDKAPAMMINDKVYGDLTAKKISEILEACK